MATIRPDLGQIEVNAPFTYLAPRVAPAMPVGTKTSKYYYQEVDSDVSAQTGRTLGAAPTSATITGSSATFTCTERIVRRAIPDSEIELVGGDLARAQIRAAKICKRSILRSIEDAAVTNTLGNASVTDDDIEASLRQAMDTAIDAVHRVPGRLVLVCGWTTFRRMTRYTEVTNALLRVSPGAITPANLWNVTADVLANVLGVQEVLVGDDDHWGGDTYNGKALVAKLPRAEVDPLEEAQTLRRAVYIPREDDPMSEYELSVYEDDNLVSEIVQARVWDEFQVLNTSGMYILKGIDEGNTTTSTSS